MRTEAVRRIIRTASTVPMPLVRCEDKPQKAALRSPAVELFGVVSALATSQLLINQRPDAHADGNALPVLQHVHSIGNALPSVHVNNLNFKPCDPPLENRRQRNIQPHAQTLNAAVCPPLGRVFMPVTVGRVFMPVTVPLSLRLSGAVTVP
jgi:hypothetical protein